MLLNKRKPGGSCLKKNGDNVKEKLTLLVMIFTNVYEPVTQSSNSPTGDNVSTPPPEVRAPTLEVQTCAGGTRTILMREPRLPLQSP